MSHDRNKIVFTTLSPASQKLARSSAVLVAMLAPFMAPLAESTIKAATAAPAQDMKALDGEWIFLDDLTQGRTLEQFNPPMSLKFSLKAEDGAVILVSGHGGVPRGLKIPLDGSVTEVPNQANTEIARVKGAWKDGAFSYEIEFAATGTGVVRSLIRREFKVTAEGMIVRSNIGDPKEYASTGLYKQAKDIPMPTPAKATIADLAWLAGNWSGTRGAEGTIAFEERWSPPKGGSMLAISRTVSRDRLSAFEYLRILERDGGLVYFAQPGGAAATEFVMTEFSSKRAVFDNPRHDYPKRIIYELTDSGGLTATIGYMKGGTPRKFEFKKEPN